MASKRTPVKPREIARMVMLYQKYGTYSKVAKLVHRSPTTVAKYVGQQKAMEYYAAVISQIDEE